MLHFSRPPLCQGHATVTNTVQIRPHICLNAKHAMKVLEFLRKTPLALVETNCHRKNALNIHCEAS